MRLMTLGFALVVPFAAAACGQSLQPLNPFDAGLGGDDLSAGGGGGSGVDMARARDLGGVDGAFDDTTGPAITLTAPTAGSFVKGVFAVEATITDPSGVDASSVSAEFGNDASTKIALTRSGGDTFAGVFDVSALTAMNNYVLAAVSVRAKDSLGNESQLGEEIIMDTVKPWMTMDSSKTMQVSKHDAANNIECSKPFSPVGSDAAHEGQLVQQLVTLRTRIEDHGNQAPGLNVDRYSGVDAATVQLFIIHDDGQTPLAVDTDGDTYCDDVNPLLVPTSGPIMMQNEALSLQMAVLPSTGTPDYTQGTATSFCPEVGDAGTMTAPKSICTDTPMTYVLQYGSPAQPAIYTLPPVKSGDPIDCSGFQLDTANLIPEGPACVVTRAADKAGNVEVSFPLHICIDKGLGNHPCDTYSPTMAHCTGVFDKVKMMPVAGTCNEPKPAQLAPANGPATFATNGSDVEFVGP